MTANLRQAAERTAKILARERATQEALRVAARLKAAGYSWLSEAQAGDRCGGPRPIRTPDGRYVSAKQAKREISFTTVDPWRGA